MSEAGLAIVGLGPAGLDRLPGRTIAMLEDPARKVILRTLDHPACVELSERRNVASCDDIYDSATSFEDVYRSIADRVLDAATDGSVIYAVPGSAVVGERAVAEIRSRAAEVGVSVEVWPGESFLDLGGYSHSGH